MGITISKVVPMLREIGRDFCARGWVLGTSGNFSAVLSRQPLRLAITASGASKGDIRLSDLLTIGPDGRAVGKPAGKSTGRPSAEAHLHVTVVRTRHASAVLHTHSVWSTMLSELHGSRGGLAIGGFEMLKGLEGVATHQHSEWLPILENDQDIRGLARRVQATLEKFPAAHGFLLRGHGLYTWGDNLAQARRHVEIFEFLLETTGRMESHS
ncbi:MAG: methylthioribulose-1-phosphate dehydratase [Acidobacteria bacterium RIFCSPLOWO2_12_FULL_65_11]|nr:MAG: methylthioribulose-1-phosphate dehydratase [Acidobacteria bacterium RIFCSPLOWO2_02_FULL_64_15]OFW29908.1 MAG: methylthioribulose-1-phosphate dehydratase [Acidobacteria bacterium RIFCSPLOWO2_12_FULL_65_11]